MVVPFQGAVGNTAHGWGRGKRGVSRSRAFGYVQCLYLKKPNRGCLRAVDPEWQWAYPIFSPREIFPPLEALVSLAKSSPHFPSLQGWVDGSSMALKMKLPLSLNTPSPAASSVAGKEKNLFSKWAEANSARQRGIDPERRAASRGQPQPADPRLPGASPADW